MELCRSEDGDLIARMHADSIMDAVKSYASLLSRIESKRIRRDILMKKTPNSIRFEPTLLVTKESEELKSAEVTALKTRFAATNGTNVEELKNIIIDTVNLDLASMITKASTFESNAIDALAEGYYLTHCDLVDCFQVEIAPEDDPDKFSFILSTTSVEEKRFFKTREVFKQAVKDEEPGNRVRSGAITLYKNLCKFTSTKFRDAFLAHRLKSNFNELARKEKLNMEVDAQTSELNADRNELVSDAVNRVVNEKLARALRRIEILEKSNASSKTRNQNQIPKKNTRPNGSGTRNQSQSSSQVKRDNAPRNRTLNLIQSPRRKASNAQPVMRQYPITLQHPMQYESFVPVTGASDGFQYTAMRNQYPSAPVNYTQYMAPPTRRVQFADQQYQQYQQPISYLDAALSGTYRRNQMQSPNGMQQQTKRGRSRSRSRTRSPAPK
jgi:hypothetical protein